SGVWEVTERPTRPVIKLLRRTAPGSTYSIRQVVVWIRSGPSRKSAFVDQLAASSSRRRHQAAAEGRRSKRHIQGSVGICCVKPRLRRAVDDGPAGGIDWAGNWP